MIALRSNLEMKATFNRLIEAMGERVKWKELFIIVDNYVILYGEVRSLFFNFDNKKVVSNIIDISVKDSDIKDIDDYPKIQNILNIILYAFGKWGAISGIRVDKDYMQLNSLFKGILNEVFVDVEFDRNKFSFMKNGKKITYEDVIQTAFEEKENPMKGFEETDDSHEGGLWHKLIWKKAEYSFAKLHITEQDRMHNRIGNNFYMVGYICPKCGNNLHMVVFPMDSPVKIDTVEGEVLLARTYTCNQCTLFYTPQPERLLIEGKVYEMDFEGDMKAYEDYQELLGAKGGRISNYKFNKFVNQEKQEEIESQIEKEDEQGTDFEKMQAKVLRDASAEQLESLVHMIPKMMDKILNRFIAMMDEGFYPESSISELEDEIAKKIKERKQNNIVLPDSRKKGNDKSDNTDSINSVIKQEMGKKDFKDEKEYIIYNQKKAAKENKDSYSSQNDVEEYKYIVTKERYKSRLNGKNDGRRLEELEQEIMNDENLDDETRESFVQEIKVKKKKNNFEVLKDKIKNIFGKNYSGILKIKNEIEDADLYEEDREKLLEPVKKELKERGNDEIQEILRNVSDDIDRESYQKIVKKIQGYEEIDKSVFDNKIEELKYPYEKREIEDIINKTKIKSRKDIVNLMKKLEDKNYSQNTLEPFMDALKDKVRARDEKELKSVLVDADNMDENEVLDIYEKINNMNILPELKTDALKSLKKRLAMLKTEECELLVKKLKEEMNGKIKDNERHHFYPAKRKMLKECKPEETEVIDCAVGTYANSKGEYEYPIIVVDTSRNKTGREGMIITPENIYCSTLFNAFYIPISTITGIKYSTGMLNKGITIEQGNNKTRIPYAVPNKEIKAWGKVLKDFIMYLKEKPMSRKIKYLEEKHDTICCYRCGYRYKNGDVCPECGFKNNKEYFKN